MKEQQAANLSSRMQHFWRVELLNLYQSREESANEIFRVNFIGRANQIFPGLGEVPISRSNLIPLAERKLFRQVGESLTGLLNPMCMPRTDFFKMRTWIPPRPLRILNRYSTFHANCCPILFAKLHFIIHLYANKFCTRKNKLSDAISPSPSSQSWVHSLYRKWIRRTLKERRFGLEIILAERRPKKYWEDQIRFTITVRFYGDFDFSKIWKVHQDGKKN